MDVDRTLLNEIELELKRQPLRINRSRKNTGDGGRTGTFGVVRKRVTRPNYSRLCWWRPKLYGLLLEFGTTHIKHDWNAITINQNYQCSSHYDAGNLGPSTVVGFGNYSGGELFFGGQLIDVRYKPFTGNFVHTIHHVLDFEGERYSLVYYYCPCDPDLPKPSVRLMPDGRHVFFMDEYPITDGLPHPNFNTQPKNIY